MNRTTILIGCPIHGSQLEWKTASAIHTPSARKDLNILKIFSNSSLLATNFNRIWATAHNWSVEHPDQKVKWFFLLHGDIIPEENWVDKMIALAEQHQTDLLSVVVPFKDQSGFTSTAVGTDDVFDIHARITMHQVFQLPPTFDAIDAAKLMGITTLPVPPLLVNSGCIIVNLEAPFARDLYFTINDQVREDKQGKLYPVTEPEDWFFARLVQSYGGKVMATREVKVAHVGSRHYNNDQVWGATWDDHLVNKQLANRGDSTIWSLDEARVLHVHSPGLAQWLVNNLEKDISVVDLGCGKGDYVKALVDAGFRDPFGYEGTPDIQTISDVPYHIEQRDITILFPDHFVFKGNVLCLEVLEHIAPADEAKVLANIKTICTGTLVLSWAVEGQNGHGHINCRNADYVVPTIEALGFSFDFVQTMTARQAAVSNNGPAFFGDTLYVFKRK